MIIKSNYKPNRVKKAKYKQGIYLYEYISK